jgi:hypothetical protein
MEMLRVGLRLGGQILLPGLFLILLLQGCSPTLNVTCGRDCGECGTGGDNGVGGCYPEPWASSAVGFYSVNGPAGEITVPQGSNAQCSQGSTRCKSSPGTCNRKPCRSYYNYGNNACYCQCQ